MLNRKYKAFIDSVVCGDVEAVKDFIEDRDIVRNIAAYEYSVLRAAAENGHDLV